MAAAILSIFYLFPWSVGLSNKLDGEFARRKPGERPHREVVGAAVVDSELPGEVLQGKESVRRIEALLILAVLPLWRGV